MAGRVHRAERPAGTRYRVALAHADVRDEGMVAALLGDPADAGAILSAPRPMRSEAVGRRPRRPLERGGGGGMVDMRVRHDDMRDRLAAKGVQQGFDMVGEVGAGIDHGDAAVSHHIGAGAFEGERPGIARDDATDEGVTVAATPYS